MNIGHIRGVQAKLDCLLMQEEMWWAQRAKMHWLKKRDKNTNYFSHKVTQRKIHNKLAILLKLMEILPIMNRRYRKP